MTGKSEFLTQLFDSLDLDLDLNSKPFLKNTYSFTLAGNLLIEESYYEEISKIVMDMQFDEANSVESTKQFFRDAITSMRLQIEVDVIELAKAKDYF